MDNSTKKYMLAPIALLNVPLLVQPSALQIGGAGYVAELLELSNCTMSQAGAVQAISSASIGDVNGDGFLDFATQDAFDQDAVAIHFLDASRSITSSTYFGRNLGGFVGDIAPLERFAYELSSLGDFDGDGVPDILVGHDFDDDGPGNAGAFWIVLLKPDGTVKDQFKISAEVGGLAFPPKNINYFGRGLAAIGDLDGNGVLDIAVGSIGASQLGIGGIVNVLMMNADGTVLNQVILGDDSTPLGKSIEFGVQFGESIACLGDLDGDGIPDLAVGSPGPIVTGTGSAWIVFLTAAGTVKSFVEITEGTPGFGADLTVCGEFGYEVTALGDLNGDGVPDLAVSAPSDDDGGGVPGAVGEGAVYILFLDPSGGVVDWAVISEDFGGLGVDLPSGGSGFGLSMDVYSGGTPGTDLVLAVGSSVGCPSFERAQFLLTLDDGLRAITYGFGNTINPAGSLCVLSGTPSIGTTFQVGIDNPLGTQAAGSLPILVLSFQPDASFPNGTLLPGFGMAGSGAGGELLISLSTSDLIPPAFFGQAWAGPGQPSPIDLTIPLDASLVGQYVFAQGVLSDPTATGSGAVRFGLTEGLEIRIGP